MQWLLCAVFVLAASPEVNVEVRTIRGSTLTGKLVELSDLQIVLDTSTGRQAHKLTELLTVQTLPQAEPPKPEQADRQISVTLVDGSVLAAARYGAGRGLASVGLTGGGSLDVHTSDIQSVRFYRSDEVLDRQWREILAGNRSADVIVLRKVSSRGEKQEEAPIGVSLDHLEGVLSDIRDDVVGFEFDGSKVNVPREKVEGIVYFHRASQVGNTSQEPTYRVYDAFGSVWITRSLSWRDGQVEWTTVSGYRRSLDARWLGKIDFSFGNLVFLGDMEPESVDWKPYLGSATTPSALLKWFQPKWNGGIYGGPLMLGGESYPRGVALHSRTLISYRLTRDYGRFLALVGVDDRFRGTGNVRLTVSSETRSLFDKLISGGDPPLDLDLDVRGVRRLQILVDFGDDRSDNGDHLNLCNARLTK